MINWIYLQWNAERLYLIDQDGKLRSRMEETFWVSSSPAGASVTDSLNESRARSSFWLQHSIGRKESWAVSFDWDREWA